MKTIEELKAEQAKQLQSLEREHAIANALPVPPLRVMNNGKRAPWITYKTETFAGALALFNKYSDAGTVRPMEYRKNGCAVVEPLATMDKKYREADSVLHGQTEYGAYLSVDHGAGYGPNVDLIFFAEIENIGFVRVCVDIEPERMSGGNLYKLRATERTERHPRTNAIVSRSFVANSVLNGYADKVISWASGDMGPIKTGASHTYLFVHDSEHITGQLTNIAGEFDPVSKGE